MALLHKITHFKFREHKYGRHMLLPFMDLFNYIKLSADKHIEGTKDDIKIKSEAFIASHCDGGRRLLSKNPISNLMVLDFDCKPKALVDMSDIFARYKGAKILYTTPSHTFEIPRFRLMIPLAEEVHGRDDYKRMTKFFVTRFFTKDELKAIDKPSIDIVHLWVLPSNGASVIYEEGDAYVPFIPPPEPEKTPCHVEEFTYSEEGRNKAERYVMATIKGIRNQLSYASEGNRSNTVNAAGYSLGRLLPSGLISMDEILSVIGTSPCFLSLAGQEGLEAAKKSMLSGIETGKSKGKVL